MGREPDRELLKRLGEVQGGGLTRSVTPAGASTMGFDETGLRGATAIWADSSNANATIGNAGSYTLTTSSLPGSVSYMANAVVGKKPTSW